MRNNENPYGRKPSDMAHDMSSEDDVGMVELTLLPI